MAVTMPDATTARPRERGLARFLREHYMPVPGDVRIVRGGRRVMIGAAMILGGIAFYVLMGLLVARRLAPASALTFVVGHLLLLAGIVGSSRIARGLAMLYGLSMGAWFLKGLVELLVLVSYLQPFPAQVHLAIVGSAGLMTIGTWLSTVDRDARAWHAAQLERRAARRERRTSLAAWRRTRPPGENEARR